MLIITSYMRNLIIAIAFLTSFGCYGQSERNGSTLANKANATINLRALVKDTISLEECLSIGVHPEDKYIGATSHAIPHAKFFPFGSTYRYVQVSYPICVNLGVIFQGDYMSLTGFVDFNTYPGMMNKEVGSIGATYREEKMHLYVGGIVNKYAYYGGLLRQIGINSEFTYQFSSPVSFTAFAYYYGNNPLPIMPNGEYMPPSMLGYYDVSKFGGYINYSTSERFGIQVGGQVVERMGPQNSYEFEPIVTPYIGVGRGKKKIGIGLPVGQIIYGIFCR